MVVVAFVTSIGDWRGIGFWREVGAWSDERERECVGGGGKGAKGGEGDLAKALKRKLGARFSYFVFSFRVFNRRFGNSSGWQ